MIKEYLEKRKSKVLSIEDMANILIYSIIIVMPFIVSSKFTYVFRSGKVAYNYVIGFILLLILVLNKARIKYKEEVIALIFLGTIFISSVLSPYKMTAFLGSEYRDEGFCMIGIYIVLFLATIKYIKINERLLDITLISANIMAIHGVLQLYGFDIVAKFVLKSNNDQSYGLIDNRNFFSTYILIFLFISCTLYILKSNKKYYFFSVPLFSALISSQTRGGWVAFFIFAMVGLLLIIKRKALMKNALIVLVSYSIIFSILNFTSGENLFGRASSIKDDVIEFDGASGSGRIAIWKIGLKMYLDRPVLGTGPDTNILRLCDDFPVDAGTFYLNYGSFIDKMHNEFLEYAVSCGIFTLIAYLLLIGTIIKNIIKNLNKEINKICLLFIIGYLVQSFFNISVVMVAPIYWIVLGAIVKISKEGLGEEELTLLK